MIFVFGMLNTHTIMFLFLTIKKRTYWQSHLLPMDMKPKITSTVTDLNFQFLDFQDSSQDCLLSDLRQQDSFRGVALSFWERSSSISITFADHKISLVFVVVQRKKGKEETFLPNFTNEGTNLCRRWKSKRYLCLGLVCFGSRLAFFSVVAPFTPPTNPPKGSILEISCSFNYQEIAYQIFGSGPMSPKILVVECLKRSPTLCRKPIHGGGVSLTFFGNCISREKVSMHYM